ncbi:hypothetical protein QTP70_016672 [Hemibagrus guttatus]|uniref:Uncharacterized protein n=1 Tax=Hemibagrus guttatus TaxID=175788 RepID=A0AAE0R9A3_9TELE|nr:hypothetical protein QTP70_016672 [Hemibagrus guttatus]
MQVFIIKSAEDSDSGTYTCRGHGGDSQVSEISDAVTLTVSVDPDIGSNGARRDKPQLSLDEFRRCRESTPLSSPGTTWGNASCLARRKPLAYQHIDPGIVLSTCFPPKGRIYPLSLPETKAMEDYIEEALALGHIRPSTSQAVASFFFVGKKDGGLCPCIDYRGLNAITIRYPYALPLVPDTLEQLRGAKYLPNWIYVAHTI